LPACAPWQVLRVNGARVNNMHTLVEAVDSCTEPFLNFELEYNQKVGADAPGARGGGA
jgi:hypothetical protein